MVKKPVGARSPFGVCRSVRSCEDGHAPAWHRARRAAAASLFWATLAARGLAEAGALSITVSTNAWSVGSVPVGGLADTWLCDRGHFVVSNSGGVAATLYACVSNSAPDGWTAADRPGQDSFRMRWSPENGSALPDYRCLLSVPTVIARRLDTNQVFRFDVEFAAPTGVSQAGVTQSIGIAVMAVPDLGK